MNTTYKMALGLCTSQLDKVHRNHDLVISLAYTKAKSRRMSVGDLRDYLSNHSAK